MGGAATSNQKAATPNRAVRMAGEVASTNPARLRWTIGFHLRAATKVAR
jgi:hypothetical protein